MLYNSEISSCELQGLQGNVPLFIPFPCRWNQGSKFLRESNIKDRHLLHGITEDMRPDENKTILRERNSGFWVGLGDRLLPWISCETFLGKASLLREWAEHVRHVLDQCFRMGETNSAAQGFLNFCSHIPISKTRWMTNCSVWNRTTTGHTTVRNCFEAHLYVFTF